MKTKNHFYAVQATIDTGENLLCWKDKKHLYFAVKTKGYRIPPPPTLFLNKSDAKKAIDEVPAKGGNLKQFTHVIEAKKVKIVKVNISLN